MCQEENSRAGKSPAFGTCGGLVSTSAFLTLTAITAQLCMPSADAFVPTGNAAFGPADIIRSPYASTCDTSLFSTPPRRAQPRRNLKKRPRRRDKRGGNFIQLPSESNPQEEEGETEWRPLAKARAVESGQDYWIDETELRKVQERERALKNRKLSVGEMPKEKLRTEVVAPYKQNWIGWFSVGIVMIATIVTQFPELLNTPVIPIPDL
mmetsp:Transcript_11510/g.32622  ORF Transcript_11510/g.32622 Transcript_11510/m.32622 type:complete len:209 (-) Transcript_11510:127-753(-)|eukprot:CAMPEP_0181046018 /NCGR_PEP_ID=MMETSP1070-20121207/14123_1 /TAXON_ID=265543 /ORGANISM="Minutocellus polymorphus, Strain NH13" /LENGTH=208 /DNA_ID=CAMNT_0023124597 /DNA_START=39 /DNA_END=665 /DNA_ORIENTATION=+